MDNNVDNKPLQDLHPISSRKTVSISLLLGVTVLLLLVGAGSYMLGQRSERQKMLSLITPTVIQPSLIPTVITNPTTVIVVPTNTQEVKKTSTQVMQELYDSYNTCIKDNNSNGQNNNGKSRIEICSEKHKSLFSNSFYSYLKTYYDKPYDPILCSQAYYDSFRIKDVDTNEGYSKVIVLTTKDEAQSPSWFVYLLRVNAQWVINEVQCPRY